MEDTERTNDVVLPGKAQVNRSPVAREVGWVYFTKEC